MYPPDRLHFNKETLDREAIFFTSDLVSTVVEEMFREYMNPPQPISLGSNFHKSFLKTRQARSIYEQYLEQAERPGDHDGIYRITLTNTRTAAADNNAALRALKYDHEEIFGLTKLPASVILGNTLTTTGRPLTYAIRQKARMNLESCVSELLKDTEGEPDIKKAEIIYNRIVAMRQYHVDDPDDYDFTGPVQKGKGCCSGYAKLFRHTMLRAGIHCVIVYGDEHAWNMALIDGKLVTFDVTRESKNGCKRYFALSVDEMNKDHKMDNIFFKEVT
jgi:hypothetical protein